MAAQSEQINSSDPRRQFGNRGEDLAAIFFESRGYNTILRNWSCRLGEIDLICEKDGVLHFVEVKTRRSPEYGHPEEAVTTAKLRHLARAVECYLRTLPAPPRNYQMDVLAITAISGEKVDFYFIENVA